MDRNTVIAELLSELPQVTDTLGSYGIRVDDRSLHATLGEVCRSLDIEVDDVLADIASVLDDDDDDGKPKVWDGSLPGEDTW